MHYLVSFQFVFSLVLYGVIYLCPCSIGAGVNTCDVSFNLSPTIMTMVENMLFTIFENFSFTIGNFTIGGGDV